VVIPLFVYQYHDEGREPFHDPLDMTVLLDVTAPFDGYLVITEMRVKIQVIKPAFYAVLSETHSWH
jgi:hypothetical protein